MTTRHQAGPSSTRSADRGAQALQLSPRALAFWGSTKIPSQHTQRASVSARQSEAASEAEALKAAIAHQKRIASVA